MGLVQEFKEFALKGNVVDLAVGVIIGASFGGLVKSLVDDVLMPPIGKAVGNLDFSNLYISLSDKVDAANANVLKSIAATQPAVAGTPSVLNAFSAATRIPLAKARELGPVIAYGNFITVIINFLIVAFVVFLVIKTLNTAMKRFEKEKAAAPATAPSLTKEEMLLTEIRDTLRSQRT